MTDAEALGEHIRTLEGRLRAVEDVQAIEHLKATYAELTDRRYGPDGVRPEAELEPIAKSLAELFTEDAVWDGGAGLGVCRGRAAIFERFLAPTLRFTWHLFVKPRIGVDGDRATGRWDVFAPCTTRAGKPMWMAGVEDDTYERVNGVWLHSGMKLDVVFMAPYDKGWTRVHPGG